MWFLIRWTLLLLRAVSLYFQTEAFRTHCHGTARATVSLVASCSRRCGHPRILGAICAAHRHLDRPHFRRRCMPPHLYSDPYSSIPEIWICFYVLLYILCVIILFMLKTMFLMWSTLFFYIKIYSVILCLVKYNYFSYLLFGKICIFILTIK